jgi:2-polyprenyl-3-methyl-5-hydroxy-6-metoxy-1,4-benzoquinol methylase
LFTERLALRAEEVVGIDISVVAIGCAADRTRSLGKVRFQQGDIMALDAELNRSFDLVVIADTIYTCRRQSATRRSRGSLFALRGC